MPVTARYVPDHSGIAAFLHSDELGDALAEAGRDIIAICVPQSRTLAGSWHQERGPDEVIGAYSRRTQRIRNDHRAAAAIEFGSGPGAAGKSGTKSRRQGGASEPHRILGKAGSRIGERRGEIG